MGTPVKRSLALCLLSSHESSIVGTGSSVAGAAAAAAAAGVAGAEGVPAAEGGGCPPVGTEAFGLGRWCRNCVGSVYEWVCVNVCGGSSSSV